MRRLSSFPHAEEAQSAVSKHASDPLANFLIVMPVQAGIHNHKRLPDRTSAYMDSGLSALGRLQPE